MHSALATDHLKPSSWRFVPTWVRLATLAACALVLSGCNVELFGNLDQKQANEIIATLFHRGIPAERVTGKAGRFSVNVDNGHFAEAVSVLNENGLPKQEYATLCEVFKKDGLVSSPVQERAQMICALGQELSRTVSEIDGVLSARVHLVLPENDPLRQQLVPSSASVFIRHQGDTPVANLIPQVKQLVANGIAGLSYDKVSVVLVPVAGRSHTAGAENAPQMANFMGLWVHSNSVGMATTIFYGLLLLLLGSVATLIYVLWGPHQRVYPLRGNKDKE